LENVAADGFGFVGHYDPAGDQKAHGFFDGHGELDDFAARDDEHVSAKGSWRGGDENGDHFFGAGVGKGPLARIGDEADGPDVLLVRLDGNNAGCLKLVLAIGEDEIGDLFDGGIDGADQGNTEDGSLGDAPEGAADQVSDEYTDEVEKDDGESDAEDFGAEIVVIESGEDVVAGLERKPALGDGIVPGETDEIDEIFADVLPDEIPSPDEEPEGYEGGENGGEAAHEESFEIFAETGTAWLCRRGLNFL